MSFNNNIIITAMDRFVWFVLLVVMSHLVTEFTRVSGYARGQRHELVLLNDTLLQPMPVQNMVLYPSQEYGQYQQRPSSSASASSSMGAMSSLQQNAAFLLSSLAAGVSPANGAVAPGAAVPGSNAAILALGDSQPAHTAESTYPMFSLRPLIDSIFEIPISTLRAVNNLVGRLTGGYRQAEMAQKSVAAGTALPPGRQNPTLSAHPSGQRMREEMA
ncbi:GM15545 [Drosophila sechellia]|uniref:GM15545 n=1 Tax=Drosophila sechellia TaxID=7238 RepID=B4I8M2_DROSE|nr:GM15545 [Drosophila sechellia]